MSRQVDVKSLISHIVRGDGIDKCRICMGNTTEGQVFLGDTVLIDSNNPVTLSELLESITGVQVQDDQYLPGGVCKLCIDEAMTAARFMQFCQQSDQHWNRNVELMLQLDNPDENDKVYFIFVKEPQIEEALVKDKIKEIKDKKQALERFKDNMIRKRKRERYVNFKIKCNLKLCCCDDCGKEFSNPASLNKHLFKTMKRACLQCGEIISKRQMRIHLAKHGIEALDCKICFQLFENPSDLKSHFKLNHNNKTETCKTCGEGFSNEKGLRAHIPVHSLFHCDCSASYENRKCFRYHINSCKQYQRTKEERFVCDYCGCVYNKKPSLRIHIVQKHLNVLPFTCAMCGKKTSTLAHLKAHESIHELKRDVLTCDLCGAKMKTKLGFDLHQRSHSGIKPFKCSECSKVFLSASRRLDHIKRKHKSVIRSAHECPICKTQFVRPFELRKHYQNVHGEVLDYKTMRRGRKYKNVTEDSVLPSGVCVSCVTSTIAAYEHRTLVQQSDRFWTHSLTALNEIPHPEQIEEQPIICFIDDDKLMTEYMRKIVEEPKKVDVLTNIQKNYLKKNFRKKERKPRTARNGPSCECKDCGKKYSSPHYLSLHLKNSAQKEVCQICGHVYSRGEELQKHLLKEHDKLYTKCSECPMLFEYSQDAVEHQKSAHKTGALTCCHCGRSFTRQSAFELHSQMHEVRTCRKCNYQFTNRVCYREHRAQCEPEAKPNVKNLPRNQRSNVRDPATFICDYCKKSYKTRPQLQNHILWLHMNVRKHQCNWCGKRFYTAARLVEHTIVHTRERKFSCDICDAKLVTKMAAVYHRRRHTGEKPYECEDCGEKFISSSRRTEHAKRRHKKGKRFQCELCPLNFVRGIELRKHTEKYHVRVGVGKLKIEMISSENDGELILE